MLVFLILIAGPLPWALAYAAAAGDARAPVASRLTALVTAWCLLETAVAVVLGFVGVFHVHAVVVAEASLGMVGVIGFGREVRAGLARLRPAPASNAERALLVAASLAATVLLLRLAVTPITDFDSLAYHLPVMAKWYQTHRFAMLEEFYSTLYPTSYYPHGWEALSALFILPFGDDFLVALPNLVAWFLFTTSIYATSVVFGARRVAALAFALVAGTTPIVRDHVTTMHVDLALAAYFMGAVALAVGARNPARAALFVATLGLVCGTKTSGLVYAVLLLAAWAFAGGVMLPKPRGPLAGAAIVAGVLVGVAWYARNVVTAGNPFGFVRVDVAGRTVFPGSIDAATIRTTTLWHAFDLASATDWKILLVQILHQLGLAFLVALLAAWTARFAFARRGAMRARDALLLLGLVVGAAVAYWTTPTSATNIINGPLTPWMGQGLRYGFPLVGLLAVAGAVGLGTVPVPDAAVATVAAVMVVVGVGNRELARATAVLISVAALGWLGSRNRRAGAVVVLTALTLFVFGARTLRDERNAARRARYGGVAEFVDAHVGPGRPVAYVGSRRIYPLAGAHLDRRVLWMPARDGDRDAWVADLRRAGIGVVAIGPVVTRRARRSRERAWLADASGPFVRVFGADDTRETVLYQLAN